MRTESLQAPPSGAAPAPADSPPTQPDRADLALAVAQHVLFWVGWGLLLALFILTLFSPAYVFEVYGRRNMVVPSAETAFQKHWYLTYPAGAAWIGCLWFRLRRMAAWRAEGRRPVPPLAAKIYLGVAIAAAAAWPVFAFVEQVLLLQPKLLGAARDRLPAGGAYLFSDMASQAHAVYDFSIPEIGYRFRPGLDITLSSAGDCIDEKGVSSHLAGAIPYRRYRLRCDARGFPGFADRPGDKADVLVVGDSYTHDAVPLRIAWPHRLGGLLDRPVYNMGVGGSGPQQHYRYFRRFGPELEPKTVVWMFFEGNDVNDAETFSRFQHSGDRGVRLDEFRHAPGAGFGKRIKCSTAWAFVRFAFTGFRGGWPADAPRPPEEPDRPDQPPSANRDPNWGPDPFDDDEPGIRYLPADHLTRPPPKYDRSLILPNRRWEEVRLVADGNPDRLNPVRFEVAGKPMELSLYYLQHSLTADEWRRHDGWQPLRQTMRDFRDLCRSRGVRLLLAYAPTKAHVYWKWMGGSVPAGPLAKVGGAKFKDRVDANLEALRDAVAGAAAEEGVEFLDLTPALQREAAKGRYVHLPHDTHWSPLGHEIAAAEIAERLRNPAPGPAKP